MDGIEHRHHARGITEDDYTMRGVIVYRAWRCDGEQVETVICHPEWPSAEILAGMWERLNAHCPTSDAVAHRRVCPGAHRLLKAV